MNVRTWSVRVGDAIGVRGVAGTPPPAYATRTSLRSPYAQQALLRLGEGPAKD